MNRIVSDIVPGENQIHQFFLNQKIGSRLKRSNIDKQTGIPVSDGTGLWRDSLPDHLLRRVGGEERQE
jgi:hypothetical protein